MNNRTLLFVRTCGRGLCDLSPPLYFYLSPLSLHWSTPRRDWNNTTQNRMHREHKLCTLFKDLSYFLLISVVNHPH